MNANFALSLLDGYIVDVKENSMLYPYWRRSNLFYESRWLGAFPKKTLHTSLCFCTFRAMEHGFLPQLNRFRACMPETSAGWASWLPAGSWHTWNTALLDFPNVTGPVGSHSDNKKSRFKRFGMLRVMCSPFYSHSFSNNFVWDTMFFGPMYIMWWSWRLQYPAQSLCKDCFSARWQIGQVNRQGFADPIYQLYTGDISIASN